MAVATVNPDLCRLAARVAERIGGCAYDDVLGLCEFSRLSASDIGTVVREYGATPCAPPPDFCDHLDAVEILSEPGAAWSVWFPVWTVEEGRSDLTMQMTFHVREGRIVAELDDLRVL